MITMTIGNSHSLNDGQVVMSDVPLLKTAIKDFPSGCAEAFGAKVMLVIMTRRDG